MSSFKEKIDYQSLPQHIAIIMDGNGRWAKERGYDRIYGHQHGVTSVRNVTEASAELGIPYLTLYAFSTENWNRPLEEVNALMELFVSTIENETAELQKNNIKLSTIGDLNRLPKKVKQQLLNCQEITNQNTRLNLILAVSYSSRWEITTAARKIAKDVETKKLTLEEINDRLFSNYLETKLIPDPDLMIRTGGEIRISNFLLWQLAYTELYFTPKQWPDFDKESFYEAIYEFQQRERRFGKIIDF
ncbi:MAG TPA: isoprenyl transferase [Paludibacteraceae bacterium]|nr:isoprenyl transferase [Paludibacteraceae bacterium]HRR62281.1 isoprenyl transferase [Paludibacteraceae bacterium]